MDPQVAMLSVLPPAAQEWEVSGVRGFDEAPVNIRGTCCGSPQLVSIRGHCA
jgi:hypothetical protein